MFAENASAKECRITLQLAVKSEVMASAREMLVFTLSLTSSHPLVSLRKNRKSADR